MINKKDLKPGDIVISINERSRYKDKFISIDKIREINKKDVLVDYIIIGIDKPDDGFLISNEIFLLDEWLEDNNKFEELIPFNDEIKLILNIWCKFDVVFARKLKLKLLDGYENK